MKEKKIFDAITDVRDEYIEEARTTKLRRQSANWKKWTAIAACAFMVIGISWAMDLNSAEHLLTMHPIPIEIICYHCQQSAEKYLKGYLVFYGMIPPKTHDLDELCKLCTKSNNKFRDIADFLF